MRLEKLCKKYLKNRSSSKILYAQAAFTTLVGHSSNLAILMRGVATVIFISGMYIPISTRLDVSGTKIIPPMWKTDAYIISTNGFEDLL